MTDLAVSAAVTIEDGDIGDWVGLDIEPAEDAARKVRLTVSQPAYERAVLKNSGYYAAVGQRSPGVAAWWVYSSDDIILTMLSDETDYASRLAAERDAAHQVLAAGWAKNIGGVMTASPVYAYPIPVDTMRTAVANATGGDPGQPFVPVVGALRGFAIANETLNINNSARFTTKYRPSDNAELLYSSNIVSAKTRKPLALTQTSPGVFELPEPGYGAIIVAYTTQRRCVSVNYEAFSGGAKGYWTDAVREQFARDTLLSGHYPDNTAPPVMMLVTSRRTHAQAIATYARQVDDVGSGMAAQQQQQAVLDKESDRLVTLTETGRQVVEKRIHSQQNPAQYVDVEVATEITLTSADDQRWLLRFGA